MPQPATSQTPPAQASVEAKPRRRPPAADATPEQRAEWGRRGGIRKAERQRARAMAVAVVVALETVAERRAVLATAVAALQVAEINEAQKVNALAAAIRLLNDMEGFDGMARELDRLRTALASAVAIAATGGVFVVRRPWDTGASGTATVAPVDASAVSRGDSAHDTTGRTDSQSVPRELARDGTHEGDR